MFIERSNTGNCRTKKKKNVSVRLECTKDGRKIIIYTIPDVLMALKFRFPSELKVNVYLH